MFTSCVYGPSGSLRRHFDTCRSLQFSAGLKRNRKPSECVARVLAPMVINTTQAAIFFIYVFTVRLLDTGCPTLFHEFHILLMSSASTRHLGCRFIRHIYTAKTIVACLPCLLEQPCTISVSVIGAILPRGHFYI